MISDINSNRADFLDCLAAVTEEAVKDLMLPTRIQSEDETPSVRAATVYKMRLPDSKSAYKKCPYILHQLITGKDIQSAEQNPESTVQVRTIFAVYSDDEQEGGMMLLNLIERLRIYLLRRIVIGERYQLDLEQGAEMLIYPDDTAPYFAGEMATAWKIPSVNREVRKWL